ncbi:MAG TPA: signal peptidase I [Methylomirabilota bacterium]|nr:signal peptidase I [Methylomirabilota bacterium]
MADDVLEAEDRPQRRVPWWLALVVGRNPKRTFIRLIIWVFGSVLIFKFALAPIRIRGLSMMPTFRNDTIHFINKLAYKRGTPQRGDVVAVRLAGDKVLLLKRVVGLPGERVAQVKGRIFIDGELLEEPWVSRTSFTPRGLSSRGEEQLGPNQYFVTGDNREISDFGPVTLDKIMGRLWF